MLGKRPEASTILIGIVVIAAIVVIYFTLKGDLKPEQAAVFGGFSAMIGWIVSVHTARRMTRKQHTMAVLTQVRISQAVTDRVKNIRTKFPNYKSIELADMKNPALADAVADSGWFLNYYEFLAVALRYGDLDHDLLRDCIRGQVLDHYRRFRVVIDDAIRNDPAGIHQSRRYRELRTLADKWAKVGIPREYKETEFTPLHLVIFFCLAFAIWAAFVAIFE